MKSIDLKQFTSLKSMLFFLNLSTNLHKKNLQRAQNRTFLHPFDVKMADLLCFCSVVALLF
jgi:hypothetical protein